MQIFDLSQPVGPNGGEPIPVSVDLLDHEAGAQVLGASHGLTCQDFPDNYAISLETVTLTTHTGTHIDAPLHYGPVCEGLPAKSIDQLPLDWFVSPGVVLHFDPDPELGAVSCAEMQLALDDLNRPLQINTIVLCNVGAAARWGTSEYFTHFRGISADAVKLLLDYGVRVIGTDAFGLDPPFHKMLDAYRDTGEQSELWPAHVLGRHHEYCQIERLTGLDNLPSDTGFTVSCLPIKLENCGAAWTRAIAIFEPKQNLKD